MLSVASSITWNKNMVEQKTRMMFLILMKWRNKINKKQIKKEKSNQKLAVIPERKREKQTDKL